MKVSLRFALFAASAAAVAGVAALTSTACSSSSSGGAPSEDGGGQDGGTDSAPPSEDAGNDSGPVDAGVDAPPTVTGMTIVTATGASLQALAGDALQLRVVLTMSDGTTQPLPTGMTVTWTTPETIVAQNPDDAGPSSIIPDAGAQPTAFYVQNPYRPERTDYPGTLFVINPGTAPDAGITVTAVLPDGGSLVAIVTVAPTPAGDPDAGADTFISRLTCGDCHGNTGAGSPIAGYDDAGPFFDLQGAEFPYPAPGLNNSTPDGGSGPNVAADPAWSASLLAMAAQGDLDNNGVALRKPMVDWLGKKNNVDGGVLNAQDFANIYSYLLTQTQ
jgi:hypothetical protein